MRSAGDRGGAAVGSAAAGDTAVIVAPDGAAGWESSDDTTPLSTADPARRARHAAGRTRVVPAGRRQPPRTAGAIVRRRARWTAETVGVAAAAFATGLLALWAASWINKSSLDATAVRWDGTWYYRISGLGYVSGLPKSPTDYAALRPAFFPGLPLLEHAVHSVVGGLPSNTTLLIGAVGLVASCLLIRGLVALRFGEEVAWRATVILAFFPGGYVFFFGYSEALFIPLAIGAVYALRRRWYLLAGVLTAAATGTRVLGVALVLACAIAAVRELLVAWNVGTLRPAAGGREEAGDVVPTGPPGGAPATGGFSNGSVAGRVGWYRLVTALASPVIGMGGLVAFMVYLHHKTGSYLAFTTAEKIGWSNTVSFTEPYHAFDYFVQAPFKTPFVTVDVIGIVVVAGCLVLLVTHLRRLGLEEVAFAGVILLAWLFTTNTGAWFRFVESAFPVLTVLAIRLDRRWYPLAACAGAAVLGILIVLFGTSVSFSP